MKSADDQKPMRSFTELAAWRHGHQLVVAVYRDTAQFPQEERFGLAQQMRRSAVSITSNIAEGFGRRSIKEKIQFYRMAQASLSELQSQFFIARDVGLVGEELFSERYRQLIAVQKMLSGLITKTPLLNS